MHLRPNFTRRDVVLLFVGAVSTQVVALCYYSFSRSTLDEYSGHLNSILNFGIDDAHTVTTTIHDVLTQTATSTLLPIPSPSKADAEAVQRPLTELPQTSIIAHAPGWTLFRNVYMSKGALLLVSDDPRESFPELRMMISTGLPIFNDAENIASREPTADNLDILTPEEARRRWGVRSKEEDVDVNSEGDGEYDFQETMIGTRVWTVEGNTLLVNDPRQFLRHYYHFVAELFFGAWAFWHGGWSDPSPNYATLYNPSISTPPLHRLIFSHTDGEGWRDVPGFDRWFLRSVFPSITVEQEEDWKDRIVATSDGSRAWHFPVMLLADRSAAHRGPVCGPNQRTASEAWAYMKDHNQLMGVQAGGWWAPIRQAVWKFAGIRGDPEAVGHDGEGVVARPGEGLVLPDPKKIVINYISRQNGNRRKLIDEDHTRMVQAIKDLVSRKEGWEFTEVEAEMYTREEQIKLVSETTIMLGVHGNGLTHLVFMPPTQKSAVIELFYPGGFAHDYEWTSRALGMRHYGVWNDTYFTYPNEPQVEYPEGFQGNSIPVHGETVAKIIEDHVAGLI